MVTDARAAIASLCRIFARRWPAAGPPPASLAAMQINRTITAVALAGVLGVGAAALTLPAGVDADPATEVKPPKVQTEVVRRTVRRQAEADRVALTAPVAAAAAPAAASAAPAPVAPVPTVDDDGDGDDDAYEDYLDAQEDRLDDDYDELEDRYDDTHDGDDD